MTDPDEIDRRIAQREQELAQLQTDATYRQIEANLVREKLKITLGTAGVIAAMALNVIGGLAAGFEASVERMADDLNGGSDK